MTKRDLSDDQGEGWIFFQKVDGNATLRKEGRKKEGLYALSEGEGREGGRISFKGISYNEKNIYQGTQEGGGGINAIMVGNKLL